MIARATITPTPINRRSRVLMVMASATRNRARPVGRRADGRRRGRRRWSRPDPRDGRRLWRRAVLPSGLDAELLLVTSLRHRRRELDPRQGRGVLEERDELVRCRRLAGDLEPLLVHAERAKPG